MFKKNNPEDKKKLERKITANEFTNLRDVIDSIAYSRDGYAFMYIRIQPISLELMSITDQKNRIRQLASEFSAQEKPYKLFAIPRPVDLTFMINNLNALKQELSTDTTQKELINDEIREIMQYAIGGETSERHFYLILWEKSTHDGIKEIKKRADDILYRLETCKLKVNICNNGEIIKFFNLFSNPNYAHLETEDIEEYIPYLE